MQVSGVAPGVALGMSFGLECLSATSVVTALSVPIAVVAASVLFGYGAVKLISKTCCKCIAAKAEPNPKTNAVTDVMKESIKLKAGKLFPDESKGQPKMADAVALTYLFHCLDAKTLAKVSRVNRRWYTLTSAEHLWNAFDICKLYPSLTILDESTWKKHADLAGLGLEVRDVPQDKRTILSTAIPALDKLSLLEVERDAGITRLTMPKGLSWQKLTQFGNNPKMGNPIQFAHISGRVENHDFVVPETYTIHLTNSILKGSRNLSKEEQKKLVRVNGCDIAGWCEMSTLVILTYVASTENPPKILLPKGTSACCKTWNKGTPDEVNPSVGDYSRVNLNIGGYPQRAGLNIDGNRGKSPCRGVSAAL